MKRICNAWVEGMIKAPPSKSMMIRAAAAGLLCKGETRIMNPSFCDDARASLHIVDALGGEVKIRDGYIKIVGGEGPQKKTYLDCMESGLCMRMFMPIAALFREETTIEGKGSLLLRPIGEAENAIRRLGGWCRTNRGKLPIKVNGLLRGGNIHLNSSMSSQFLTGLLIALPSCDKDSEIITTGLSSKPYISMTLEILSDFGIVVNHDDDFERFFIAGSQHYRSNHYLVEGDWSGASFFLVAGAIRGRVGIQGLSIRSKQADLRILDVLKLVGAKVTADDNFVFVENNSLKSFEFDATHCPDLFPPLIALACSCQGRSEIHGVERLFFKESNRANVLCDEFKKIGARLAIEDDTMLIDGGPLNGGVVNSHGDHRIAMAAAVAGLVSREGISIQGWRCVSKSYPRFYEDLESIYRCF